MSPEREENGEGANDMHYPSPGAEPMDAGPFYHAAARDGANDEHQDNGEHHTTEHATEHLPEQGKGQESTGIHQNDPETPHQQTSRPANIEELQLAAQLGQGLAGTPMMSSTDPNMSVEDPGLRNIMPHPEHDHQHQQQPQPQPQQQQQQQQQAPAYMHETPTSDSVMAHGLQVNVGAQLPPHYGMMDNSIPPRKRSKVSRACDECRRKKIKCDAPVDNGDAPCSSCARSNTRCLFSRVPQKRGPSKGYIKDLADRIHSIESKLESEGGLTQEDLSGIFGDRSRLSQPGEESGRKRPFSSISGGEMGSPSSGRHAPWESETRPLQPAAPGQSQTAFDSSSLAPQPVAPKVDETRAPEAVMDVSMTDMDETLGVDEGVLQDYLATLQSLYPILPSSQSRLENLLAPCNSAVRTAFSNALLAVAQSSSGNVKLANSLLSAWENGDLAHSEPTDVVHAQTLLLLLIDAEWRGSPTVPSLLGRAVALANRMKLWRYRPVEAGAQPDSDENLRVRLWWSLVLIDRFHAVGTGSPVLIPDSGAVMPPGLGEVLGDTCWSLLRLSKILSKVSQVVVSLPSGSTTAADPVVTGVLADYVENFREDLPAGMSPQSHPLVFLGFWHCRLLVMLLAPEADEREVMQPTKELMDLLSANSDMRSPLTNHFGFLVAMALSRLSRAERTRDEAAQLMKDVLDRPGVVWDGIRDKLSSEQTRPTSSSAEVANLQHLADLATAHQGLATDSSAEPSLTHGYLPAA